MAYTEHQGFLCLLCTSIKVGEICGERERPSSARLGREKTTGARREGGRDGGAMGGARWAMLQGLLAPHRKGRGPCRYRGTFSLGRVGSAGAPLQGRALVERAAETGPGPPGTTAREASGVRGRTWVRIFPVETRDSERSQLSPRGEEQQFPTGPSEGSVIRKIPCCLPRPGRSAPLTCLGEHRSSRN